MGYADRYIGMATQQTRNRLFPQVRRLTDRLLGHALTIAEEEASVLLLGESGLGPEARQAFIAEVREELERRRTDDKASA